MHVLTLPKILGMQRAFESMITILGILIHWCVFKVVIEINKDLHGLGWICWLLLASERLLLMQIEWNSKVFETFFTVELS